ncbi:dTMP kinase [Altericroceibacterium endophyticum]|uniref:Thymidylate kinase n=1 Tax=Altericroceibacterium endophyticum TaxID=1808508 RepID=A0A6I4T0R8_9SPHN|nr:dTMP kinase [Altericroceibacterium endophyticum]MXO64518.1 dTMP kinase [Altericroceibacterium endophyticum]
MKRGRFISLEGGEGVGKSTQARLLESALAERNIPAIITREPGGTSGAEAVRSLLLDPENPDWGYRAEALLFAAARADHVERCILPALQSGQWVICDRFIDSTRAYQGGDAGLSDAEILALHAIGSGGLLPDRTFLLEVPAVITAQRLAKRDGTHADRIGGRDATFHEKVARIFGQLAEAEPQRFCRITADKSPEAVHQQIWQALQTMLAEPD